MEDRGQVIVEYFLLFAAFAAATVLAATLFDDNLRASFVDLFNAANVVWDY